MTQQRTLSIKEIFEMITDKNFLDGDDDKLYDSKINIIKLPPDTIDKLSDREEFYYNNMDDEAPTDAPRH